MTMLDSKKLPEKLERVVITRLDNGYCVEADTHLVGRVAHYCSNLKGVTKALWYMFEGKVRMSKSQQKDMQDVLKTQAERMKKDQEEDTDA